jgi:beta-galactosidase
MPRADVRWSPGVAGRLCYGGDYNPEQWPEEVWREDVALMRRAAVNLVSVGVFAWSRLEPREGEFEFGWLDRILDLLDDGGVRVALATPTASPPPWFSVAHPDALPVTRDGVRLVHGSRDTYCPSAPAYRAAAVRMATELGRRYAGHPALALWHVHNEYATSCWCDHVATAFREWLRRRYGTLDRLNEAWTTSFWSQWYGDWAQILPPRATRYLANPTQALDFRRFTSDELLACFRDQRDALRSLTPDVPVTTNVALGPWVPLDPWSWAREVDLVAIDHYPADAGPLRAEEETAFAADLARGWAGGGPWLLMEQAPNLIYTGPLMVPKEPGRMSRLTLTHIARGSGGAMFFQWRAPRGGAERFHSAMVPHAGPDTRAFAEVVELGRTLRRIADPRADRAGPGPIEAGAAIVWHPESWWALQEPGLPSAELDYAATVRSVHAALWRTGVTVDVVSERADLSAYRLVLVPALYQVRDEAAAAMESYVDGGGTLAVWYLSGTADPDGRIRPGGYAGAFRDALGIRVEEAHPLPAGATVTLSTGETGRVWSELIRLAGAETVASYATGTLAGEPAVTRRGGGRGSAWYVSTELDADGLDRLVRRLAVTAGLPVPGDGHPPGLELVRRRSTGGDAGGWLFAINHTAREQVVVTTGVDLVSGSTVDGTLRLGPGAFAVIVEAGRSSP